MLPPLSAMSQVSVVNNLHSSTPSPYNVSVRDVRRFPFLSPNSRMLHRVVSDVAYENSHQRACCQCQEQAARHFSNKELGIRRLERGHRNNIEVDESERRRQLYRIYLPLHSRLRNSNDLIVEQRIQQQQLSHLQQCIQVLQHEESISRTTTSVQLWKSLRALHRAAARFQHDLGAQLDVEAAKELMRFEEFQRQEAQRVRKEKAARDLAFQLSRGTLVEQEEHSRDLLSTTELREMTKLVLLSKNNELSAKLDEHRRIEIRRYQERASVTQGILMLEREGIEGAEKQERQEIQTLFLSTLVVVRKMTLHGSLETLEQNEERERATKEQYVHNIRTSLFFLSVESTENCARAQLSKKLLLGHVSKGLCALHSVLSREMLFEQIDNLEAKLRADFIEQLPTNGLEIPRRKLALTMVDNVVENAIDFYSVPEESLLESRTSVAAMVVSAATEAALGRVEQCL